MELFQHRRQWVADRQPLFQGEGVPKYPLERKFQGGGGHNMKILHVGYGYFLELRSDSEFNMRSTDIRKARPWWIVLV